MPRLTAAEFQPQRTPIAPIPTVEFADVCRAAGLKTGQVAALLQVPPGTVRGWHAGHSRPPAHVLAFLKALPKVSPLDTIAPAPVRHAATPDRVAAE